MTDEAMSPLRRRMIEDMTIRKFAPKTQHDKLMTLATDEFIRRFLIHVLPAGFHRIRHYGLLAKPSAADHIARARELLAVPRRQPDPADATDGNDPHPCPHRGGRMIIIETFACGSAPRHRPTGPMLAIRIDTS
jgi:hypothetical protein